MISYTKMKIQKPNKIMIIVPMTMLKILCLPIVFIMKNFLL